MALPDASIKTYALRRGRMTDAQKRDYSALAPRFCIPFSPSPVPPETFFGNARPVIFEIGFGMGGATSALAAAAPLVNFLGADVHTPGAARLLGDIRRLSLTNIRIIEHDALEICAAMLPPESAAAVHLFFPDPWPKTKHHKRRIITPERAPLIASVIKPGGYLYFVTDWEDYAVSALRTLTAVPSLVNAFPGYAPRQAWRPVTKFETRGALASRPIRELYFIKRARPAAPCPDSA